MRKDIFRILVSLALTLALLASAAPAALASGSDETVEDAFIRVSEGATIEQAVELCEKTDCVFIYVDEPTSIEGRIVAPEALCIVVEGTTLTVSADAELVLDGGIMVEGGGNIELYGTLGGSGWIDLGTGGSDYIITMHGSSFELTGSVFADSFRIYGLDEEDFSHDEAFACYRLLSEEERAAAAAQPSPEPEPEPVRGEAGDASYTDPETGYRAIIMDELGLLSGSERDKLIEDMKPLLRYGNIAFWTTDDYTSNEVKQAQQKRRALFDLESASILVINMEVRRISIQSYGDMYDIITIGRANEITNYVRNYGTRGEYYELARIAFGQELQLMRGNEIARPMKHFSNACIALMTGLIVMFMSVFKYASTFRRPDLREMATAITAGAFTLGAAKAVHTGQTRTYSPPSSDSSSGSSCSSCGGGGSSCSSCGGGGSSSF